MTNPQSEGVASERPMTKEERAVIEAAMKWGVATTQQNGCFLLRHALNDLIASRAPKRCEPPEEFRSERLHWLVKLNTGMKVKDVRAWVAGKWWKIGGQDNKSPEETAANGWSYHSPCLPPGSEPEKVEISDMTAWELAAVHANYLDEHGLQSFNCYHLGNFARAVLARFTLPAMTDDEIIDVVCRFSHMILDGHITLSLSDLRRFARIVRGEKAE